MDIELQEKFEANWINYFGNAELPLCMWFGDEAEKAHLPERKQHSVCFIGELASVRKGNNRCVTKQTIGCGGARRYLGYSEALKPNFEYFLSCGNEQMQGERYVQTPEEALRWLNRQQFIPIHNRTAYFKRWDKVEAIDNPELVIFFATPDVLSGIYTLFNYCNFRDGNIEAPFGAGCNSIITKPYLNTEKAFIGMFDPTARKCVTENIITFSFHFKHMLNLVNAMDNSFLTTKAWGLVRKRLEKQTQFSHQNQHE
ncbi:MAG: DUF169 domain-containing protein [Bacteroidetes bacterium]|nr:DUF169 domain-containing protein [Bacteroidota bacterium]